MVYLLWWIVTTQKLLRKENQVRVAGIRCSLKGVQKTKISDILKKYNKIKHGILMKKLKRSTGETQLLSKLRCSLLYSLSTFCCTCFRACCKGHAKVKYESFAQKLKILMFEYQKTGNVSLTQNPGGRSAENTTTFKEDLIQQT